MAQALIAALPPNIELIGDYIIRLTALNPSTGATVSGVTISDVVITALDVNSGQVITGTPAELGLEPIFEMPGTGT